MSEEPDDIYERCDACCDGAVEERDCSICGRTLWLCENCNHEKPICGKCGCGEAT